MAFQSPKQPLCVCCKKPIPKKTEWHFFKEPDKTGRISGGLQATGKPFSTTKEEAQRHLNSKIVAIRYADYWPNMVGEGEPIRYVHAAYTWDGESYRDKYFCGGPCRDGFAYAAAKHFYPSGKFTEGTTP